MDKNLYPLDNNKGIIYTYSKMKEKEKPFLMREPIHKEGRTVIEKIEYWLFKHGIGGQKSFCKWHRTLVDEVIDDIDLDVKDIKVISNETRKEKK